MIKEPVSSMRLRTAGSSKAFLVPALILALATLLLVYALQSGRSALGPVGLALGVWLVAGAATDLWSRTGSSGAGRLLRLPRADWGKAIAHSGMGVIFIGIAGLMAWDVEDVRTAKIGETSPVVTPTMASSG